MNSILDKIVAHKVTEIASKRAKTDIRFLESAVADAPPTRAFTESLLKGPYNVITELKCASPSQGIIRDDFDPRNIARDYERGGANCLSVLTDQEFFGGHDDHLIAVRQTSKLPVLRKDFILDSFQVLESRVLGADCVLLIASILKLRELRNLYHLARSSGMDVLIEVHNRRELDLALALQPRMVGINNRDLQTFVTSLETSVELSRHVPSDVLAVSESGIKTDTDVRYLREHGIGGFLIGEALMRARNPGLQLRRIFGTENREFRKTGNTQL